jgi:hypothetical protein
MYGQMRRPTPQNSGLNGACRSPHQALKNEQSNGRGLVYRPISPGFSSYSALSISPRASRFIEHVNGRDRPTGGPIRYPHERPEHNNHSLQTSFHRNVGDITRLRPNAELNAATYVAKAGLNVYFAIATG